MDPDYQQGDLWYSITSHCWYGITSEFLFVSQLATFSSQSCFQDPLNQYCFLEDVDIFISTSISVLSYNASFWDVSNLVPNFKVSLFHLEIHFPKKDSIQDRGRIEMLLIQL